MTSDESNHAVEMYLRELGGVQPLTKCEENALLKHLRIDDEHAKGARWRLIEGNLALVVSIAERYCSTGVDLIDVITEGNLALKTALETFHKSGSDNFSEHAAQCIESALSARRTPE